MNLRIDNPYITGRIVDFGDSSPIITRKSIDYEKLPNDELHVVTFYDTLDTLAGKKYGNSKLWWIIGDANKLISPFDLEVGKVIILPDWQTIQALYL